MKQKHPTQPTPNDDFGKPLGVVLRNVGAVDITPWSLLEVVDSYVTAVADPAPIAGQLVLKVQRPTSNVVYKLASSGPVAIPAGKQGPGFYGPVLPLSQGTEPGVGNQCRSTQDSFALTPGVGPLRQLTSDADVNLYAVDCVQPAVGFLLTGPESGGTAPGSLIDPVNSTVLATGITVHDPFSALTGKTAGFKIACVYCWDRWIAVGGTSSGTDAIGFANAGIPARVGTTPGKASVYLYQISADTLSSTIFLATVYNLSTTAIGSGEYIPIHKEYLTNQWIASEGTGGGGGGTPAEPFCGMIRFQISEVSTKSVKFENGTSADMAVASVSLLSRPCECTEVPEEIAAASSSVTPTIAEIYDPMGCHFDEAFADLVGRQGTAAYMKKTLNPPRRTDGVYKEGYNFRDTLAFVTDGADETHVDAATTYPTFGWVDTALVSDANRDATVDRRLAGICHPTGSTDVITFKVDLPSAGLYRINLALGDAIGAGTVSVRLLDGATLVKAYSESYTSGTHIDAQGAVHTSAAWPGSNASLDHEFTTTELSIELTGTDSKLNHVQIQSLIECWWEVQGLCCLASA